MDLRIVKTLKSIETAFVALAGEVPIDKITIKQLCETALINKATFYLHFENMDALIEYLERQEVRRFIESAGQTYQTADNPAEIMEDLLRYFSESQLSRVLLSGGRRESFLHKLLDAILQKLVEQRSLVPGSREELGVCFILYGIFGMIPRYLESTDDRRKELAREISLLSLAIKTAIHRQGGTT